MFSHTRNAAIAAFLTCTAAFLSQSSLADGQMSPPPKSPVANVSGDGSIPSGAATVSFTVVDGSDAGTLAFQAPIEAWSRRLLLSFDPKVGKGPMSLTVGDLYLDDGTSVKVEIAEPGGNKAGELTINTPSPPVEVRLSATLTRTGVYSGYLRLKMSDQINQIKQLKITRTAQDFPGVVSQAFRIENSDLFNFKEPASFTISVQAPMDQAVTVTPAFFQLSLAKDGDKVAAQPAAITLSNNGKSEGSVVIPANQIQQITVQVPGLTAAGKYNVVLKFLSPDRKATEQTFDLIIKRSWFWALLLILLGASASIGIKYLVKQARPRLVIRQAVSALQSQAVYIRNHYGLNASESAVMDAILARISTYWSEATSGNTADANWATNARTALLVEERKLHAFSDWVNARRSLDSVDLPDAKRSVYAGKLEAIRAALLDDADLPQTKCNEIAKLASDIEGDKREVLAKPLQDLQKQVTTVSKGIDATESPEADAELKKAGESATQAQAQLDANDFGGFAASFDAAGLAYVRGLALNLQSRLPSDAATDGAFAQAVSFATPASVRENVRRALSASNGRQAEFHYEKAQEALVQSQLAGRQVLADSAARAQILNTPAALDAMQLLVQLHSQDAVVPDNPLRKALAPIPYPMTNVIEDTAALSFQTRRIDFAVNLFAVLVTGVLGIELVWMVNPAWGQLSDFLSAFLWGLGLSHVTSSTFQGITSIKDTLTS